MSQHPPPTNTNTNTNTNKSTGNTTSTDTADRLSTFGTLKRLYPFVKPAFPRIVLGMVAALLASVVALLIPFVLQQLVDGPLSSGDSRQVWPAFWIVLGLGVVEAVMIMGDRKSVV